MPNKLTLMSQDGQWKAELHAWKSNWIIYKSIGSECTVYHREQTKNVWGQSKVDWVKKPSRISITNIYKGNGLQISRSTSVNASHAELKEWAWGFLKIDVNIDTGAVDPGPTSAILIIDSVEGNISVGIGVHGIVSADTEVVQQSIW